PAFPTTRVVVLHGSQSGNAEGLAHGLADRLKTRLRGDGSAAFAPEVLGMDRFQEVAWDKEAYILMATSTWGDGDMPDNAAAFWDWLKGPGAPSLAHLKYSVLGLGDRNYNRFCQAGKQLDARFAELGAARLAPFCECDTDYESRSAAWMEESLKALEALVSPGTASPAGSSASAPAAPAAVNGAAAHAPAKPAASAYSKKNPFPAALLENHPLNAKGSAKDTRHISLSLQGSGLEYKVGDALGVIPRNCYDLVDRIILALNCLGNEKVTLESGETAVLRSTLLSTFDLRRAPLKLLENLRHDARNQSEKRRLEDLLAGDGALAAEYLDGKDVLDVLEDFPHSRLEAQRLVECLGKLAPRLYSISSSPLENPGEVHLTVGVVRYEADGRHRRGVASTYLAERVPLGMPVQVFVQPTSHFHLPAKPGVPIIMVGPGTGIAPFRAFLQERRALGDTGRNWLFFGDQRRRHDFLYGEELVAWQESGFLTRLDLAFSRDQEEKVYVQDRMLEASRELYAWLEEGARFYVCGDAKRMAKDVESALLQVVAREGGKTAEGAKAYLEDMKAQKRYLRDVY
ncbi:MAG TPA: sulfite reductase subunit alpha, partial [Fibrobacteria bacterium]|nr:sulfite reductase subunit alpha [Fibrobacteria bacterium]